MKENAVKWILVLVAIVVIAFAGIKIVQSLVTPTGKVKEFEVKAFRFGFEPNEIVVNRGDKVKITINNTDTLHGIKIPELNISGDNAVEFVAGERGEFTWYCNNYCGSGHRHMSGKLIVK